MKKIAILMASLILGTAAYAQNETEPNRLLINDTAGATKGYVINRVQDVTFGRVDGVAQAQLQVHEVGDNQVTVSITRSEACEAFKLDVLPRPVAAMLTDDAALINYFDSRCSQTLYYEDFVQGSMTGITLTPGGEYTLVSIGLDKYGVEDGVCRVDFQAPTIPVVGNPKVDASLESATTTSFTVKFVPNSDVTTYYTVAGEKGELAEQYLQFGAMFGFASMTDMVVAWGIPKEGTTTNTWNDMAPNTDYEVYIVCYDKNGNPAPMQIFECATASQGGEGKATVDIKIGDYKMADWGGEMKPSQFVTFTPDDQTASYRFGVYIAEQYDASPADIKEALCSEPPMPSMANWFFYDPLTTDFQIDPNTECVAIAAGKNIKGQWGDVTEVRFTTPAAAASAPATGYVLPRLKAQKNITLTPGKVPQFTGLKTNAVMMK